MTAQHDRGRSALLPIVLLALLAVARLVSLGLYPLMDTSEARYAEIARKMVETGDWITPWFDVGVPFWGKPPLAFWLDAISFRILGVGEFPARFPHWLLSILLVGVFFDWMRRANGRYAAAAASLILFGSLLFFVVSGAVLTDMALALGATLVMCGFLQGMEDSAYPSRRAVIQVFLGLAIGLLAKGPVMLVLAGVPPLAWTLLQRRLREGWQRFPWLAGLAVVAVIVVPWYVLAEIKTPGFLEYFIVGEHWNRFVVTGWAGDRYGTAHAYPHGKIWLFYAQSAFPWIVILPVLALVEKLRGKEAATKVGPPSSRVTYLLLWAAWPAVFFTFAGNVLWTYVLPGMPALAALAGLWLSHRVTARVAAVALVTGSVATLAILYAAIVYMAVTPGSASTARELVAHYRANADPGEPLVYVGKRPFSAEFYSRNHAALVTEPTDLSRLMEDTGSAWVAVSDRQREKWRWPADVSASCRVHFHKTWLCHAVAGSPVREAR